MHGGRAPRWLFERMVALAREISLAVVTALYRWQGGGPWSLLLCGVSTGLALLSKSPALILVPLMPLLLPHRHEHASGVRLRATVLLDDLLLLFLGEAHVSPSVV